MKTGKMKFLLNAANNATSLEGQADFEKHFNCSLTPSRQGYGTFDIDSNSDTFEFLVGLTVQDCDGDGNNFILKPRKISNTKIRVEIRDVAGNVTDLCNEWYITISTGELRHNLPFNLIGDVNMYYKAPTYMYFSGMKEAGTGTITLEVSTNNGASWSSRSFSGGGFAMNEDDILRIFCADLSIFKTITLY